MPVPVPVRHWHVPLLQTLLLGQTMPQPPQFDTLEVVFTQTPLHAVVPLGHAHWLFVQTRFWAQI